MYIRTPKPSMIHDDLAKSEHGPNYVMTPSVAPRHPVCASEPIRNTRSVHPRQSEH